MNLDDITVVIPVFNEEPNLPRTLERLRWARRVILVDSFSTDGTADIAGRFPNVEVVDREYVDQTTKWTQGTEMAETPWVLGLDADYVLGQGFEDELRSLVTGDEVDAWHARFRYCVNGHPLRGTLYPPRAVLFRKSRCHFVQDGHTQVLVVQGGEKLLQTPIDHDDRKPLTRWFASQDHCARQEADKLSTAAPATLRIQDRVRQWLVVAPVATLFYCLFAKGLILDGWHGWFYTWQRVLAEIMLSIRLLERKVQPRG